MKESEAKTKWCPMTVFANYMASDRCEIPERYPEGTKAVIASRCIGSDCMLWREEGGNIHDPNGDCGLKR